MYKNRAIWSTEGHHLSLQVLALPRRQVCGPDGGERGRVHGGHHQVGRDAKHLMEEEGGKLKRQVDSSSTSRASHLFLAQHVRSHHLVS